MAGGALDRDDLEDMAMATLFDVLAEVEAQLRGRYATRSRDEHLTADECAAWRQKALDLRDEFRGVGPDDPDRMVALIERWSGELSSPSTHG